MGSRVNGGKSVARRKGNFCIHRNNAFTFTSLKKNLFIVGLEIRRESDSFDRSDQIPIFSFLSFPSFFFSSANHIYPECIRPERIFPFFFSFPFSLIIEMVAIRKLMYRRRGVKARVHLL